MDIKNQEWLEIFLGYRCNIKCNFCYQKDLRKEFIKNIDKEEVLRLLIEGIEDWKKFVIFSGWEPTLDKNLSSYIEFSKKLGYEHIRVHTNGWWFKNYQYLEDLYNKWLTWVTLSIHWYWKIQDIISWVKWNFDFLFQALINFEKLKRKDKNFIFDTNTVICKQNSLFLFQLFKFLHKFSITRRMLTFPYNISNLDNIEYILPNNFQFLKEVEKVLEFMLQNNVKDFVLETLPYCLIDKKYWDFIEKNFKTNKWVFRLSDNKISNEEWINHYFMWKYKFSECDFCLKKDYCFGFSDDFIKFYWKISFNIIK